MAEEYHIESVKGSGAFQRAQQKAEDIANDEDKINSLLTQTKDKLKNINLDDRYLKAIWDQVNTFIRMIKAYINGSFKEVPWKSLLALIAGLIYFITPIDLIPDFIPVMGLLDDLTILLWISRSLQADIVRFKMWEEGVTTSSEGTDSSE